MKRNFTISIFSENRVGLLNRITIVFTRRHLNIERITLSLSEVKDVGRITIVVNTTREQADKVVRQIEKLIDVLLAFVHEEAEVIYQELALFKMSVNLLNAEELKKLAEVNSARILTVDKQYVVIEKTGRSEDINDVFNILEPYDILEFSRSGRVAVTKPMKKLTTYLHELELAN